jgi:glucan phosphoethanolaminetransferase (alkaline phosphatase superfamily)
MDIDHFMAFVTTNMEESSTFVKHNLHALYYIIPLVIVFGLVCFIYSKSMIPTFSRRIYTSVICICVTMGSLLPWEKMHKINGFHDVKVAIFANTFTRPPLNILHLTKITIRKIHRSLQTNDFKFNSTRSCDVDKKEVYVLAIGESVRYMNCSLNGMYNRRTMPLLEQQKNLLFFHNYYSGGCSTSISVPMLVTRATADANELNYKEKSIIQVFNENDFTTVVIKRGILSQISSAYLYQGVDYTVEVKSDAEVMEAVDSVAKIHDKLFVMFQLQGSHFYYDNFPEEFNMWRPNCKYDKNIPSDSLYINAYDNTILYTDYLLNNMLDSLKELDCVSAVWYVSDHGQVITSTQGWHGTAQGPEEYHVPLCVWFSDEYEELHQGGIEQLKKNLFSPINSDNLFYTICGMTNILLPECYAKKSWDISSREFQIHPRQIFVGDSVRFVD